jgi:hypothetical protein
VRYESSREPAGFADARQVIVVAKNDALDFDALQLRIHPAASREKKQGQATFPGI